MELSNLRLLLSSLLESILPAFPDCVLPLLAAAVTHATAELSHIWTSSVAGSRFVEGGEEMGAAWESVVEGILIGLKVSWDERIEVPANVECNPVLPARYRTPLSNSIERSKLFISSFTVSLERKLIPLLHRQGLDGCPLLVAPCQGVESERGVVRPSATRSGRLRVRDETMPCQQGAAPAGCCPGSSHPG